MSRPIFGQTVPSGQRSSVFANGTKKRILLKRGSAKKSLSDYYNNDRISLKRKGMSPVPYRAHSQTTEYFILSKL
ncbi:MAG: IS3 family transposase [Christensenellaceae bacterium]